MADIKLKYATAQSLTVSGLNSLSGGAYTTSNEVDNTSTLYVDVLVEILIADISESGNQQVKVFAISSLDGTNFSGGFSDNPNNMIFVGSIPTKGDGSSGKWRSQAFSMASAFRTLPPKFKLVFHNDNGAVALASTGNSVQYIGIHYQSV